MIKKLLTYMFLFLFVTSFIFLETASSYELHEWGVFSSGYDCSNSTVLTESPPVLYAYKPVIYFHSLENKTNVEVEIESIKNVTAIPNATIGENKFLWNVTIIKDWIQDEASSDYEYGPYKYHKYLFYEGEIDYSPNIAANVTTDGEYVTFYVKNLEDYSLSNLYFTYANYIDDEVWFYRGLTYIQIEKLESNEEKSITVELEDYKTYDVDNLTQSLIEKGLTEKEAKEMVDYWERFWFGGGNTEPAFARLFYIIPQEIYDELLPISISPEPDEIKRVGVFTITEIPVPDFTKTIPSSYYAEGRTYIFELVVSIVSIVIALFLFIFFKKRSDDKLKSYFSTLYFGIGSIAIYISIFAISQTIYFETWEYNINVVIFVILFIFASILLMITFYGLFKSKKFSRFTGVIGCIFLLPYLYTRIVDELPYIYETIPEICILTSSIVLILLTLKFRRKI